MSRFAAILFDRITMLFVMVPGIVLIMADSSQNAENEGPGPLGIAGMLVAFGGLMVFNLFQWIMISSRGQSLGKHFVGIRIVIGKTNRPPGFVTGVLLRSWLITALSVIPFIGGLLALVDSLLIFGSDRRCLHDKMANTNVVEGNPPRKR